MCGNSRGDNDESYAATKTLDCPTQRRVVAHCSRFIALDVTGATQRRSRHYLTVGAATVWRATSSGIGFTGNGPVNGLPNAYTENRDAAMIALSEPTN